MSGTFRVVTCLLLAAGCGGARAGSPATPAAAAPAASGSPGPSCADLERGYAEALLRARRCDPSAAAACAAVRPARLEDPCRCETSVEPHGTAELDRLAGAHRAAACPRRPLICNRSCLAPDRRCLPDGGAGRCAGG